MLRFELCVLNVSVDLCGGNITMPEHQLYTSKVCSLLYKMRGKSMAKRMWGQWFVNPCFECVGFNNVKEILSTHACATIG